MYWNRSNPNYNGNRRGKVALRPPASKISNSRLSKQGQIVSM